MSTRGSQPPIQTSQQVPSATAVRRLRLLDVLGLIAGIVATGVLLGPWIQVGGRSFSTISALASAGALDVISGWRRVASVALWMAVPLSCGGALVAAAVGRRSISRLLLGIVGCLTLLFGIGITAAVAATARESLRWGCADVCCCRSGDVGTCCRGMANGPLSARIGSRIACEHGENSPWKWPRGRLITTYDLDHGSDPQASSATVAWLVTRF